jgi:hypothetical protein
VEIFLCSGWVCSKAKSALHIGGEYFVSWAGYFVVWQDVPILAGFFPFSRQVFSGFICFDASQP